MNALDAAEQILHKSSHPLYIADLAAQVLQSGLWFSQSKAPEQTLHAQIAQDIKRQQVGSRFQRTAKSTFALRAWGLPEFTTRLPGISVPSTSAPILTSTFTDAAETVLEQCAQRAPMHYQRMTQEALKLGLLKTQGQTPEATMYAQILTEISRAQRRGQIPRFTRHGKGLVGLTKWLGSGLQAQIRQHNDAVAKKLHAHLAAMPPAEFEDLVGALLVKMGFEGVTVTSRSNDGGIDVRGVLAVGDAVRVSMAVQVKRWKHNVQSPTVQQMRGALGNHEQGLIITTSGFSKGAASEAQRANAMPVGLIEGTKLVALLMEHELGVYRSSYDLYEIGAAP